MLRQIIRLPLSVMLLATVSANCWSTDDNRQFRTGQTVYVHSLQGLNLRHSPSRTSSRIARMIYSTRLKVVTNSKPHLKVSYDNVNGHWVQVQLGHLRGYVFSGLISRFPTPDSTSFNQYQQILQKLGMTHSDNEPAQIIAQRANLSLREASIIDGFLIARRLFGIPQRFKFPHSTAMRVTIVTDPLDRHGDSTKSVQIVRDTNGLLNKIIYFDKQSGWQYRSSITSSNNGTIELQALRHETQAFR